MRYNANPPVAGERPHTLILGTFPSPLSREKREYYGNPRNQFWRILFAVFDRPFDDPDYAEKTALLTGQGFALWDTVLSCEIEGALDTAIRNAAYNTELPGFIRRGGVRRVFFNGSMAETFYRRHIGFAEGVAYAGLPSTSPANARLRFEQKLAVWRARLLP
jgi:TDG/mug DNA glycosylase family protein